MFISILYLTTYCEVQASKMAANFPDHPDTSQAVKNQLRLSENYTGRPEIFQNVQKFSNMSGNIRVPPKTFQTVWRNFQDFGRGRA